MTRPWPAGAATGIGSLPGTDAGEAVRLVFGELPDLPHLPELPARGAGADLLGRGATLLVDLPVELAAGRWTFTSRLKVQAAGPWTLAAGVELRSGHRVITDHGATRDLAASLAEGLRLHLAEVASRVPGARLVVQLDEPSLPAVLGGTVPTPSGWGTVRAVDPTVVQDTLRGVLGSAPEGGRVVHCCAADVPIPLLQRAGADAVAVDAALLGDADHDMLGEAVDAGLALWLGVLPSMDATITLDSAREPIRRLWNTLGFPVSQLAADVVPTPACGLAGAGQDYVRRALSLLRDTGRSLLDDSA